MIDDNSVKSIIANGGWCEVNHQSGKPLTDQLNGRIIFNVVDYLIIDRFNLDLGILDGFYLFFRPNIKKLKKGYWVKKYLTVGGKLIEGNNTPQEFICESWLELLGKLQSSSELLKFKLKSLDILGYVKEYTPTEIKVSKALMTQKNSETVIEIDSLICIEARTKEIVQTSKKVRRQLT